MGECRVRIGARLSRAGAGVAVEVWPSDIDRAGVRIRVAEPVPVVNLVGGDAVVRKKP